MMSLYSGALLEANVATYGGGGGSSSAFAVFLTEVGMEVVVKGEWEEDVGKVVGVELVSVGVRSEKEEWRVVLDDEMDEWG